LPNTENESAYSWNMTIKNCAQLQICIGIIHGNR
jgi:hypothetical protein